MWTRFEIWNCQKGKNENGAFLLNKQKTKASNVAASSCLISFLKKKKKLMFVICHLLVIYIMYALQFHILRKFYEDKLCCDLLGYHRLQGHFSPVIVVLWPVGIS